MMSQMVKNREIVIKKETDLQSYAATHTGNFLHLGCGARILPGFHNIDKYFVHPEVTNFDIFRLPDGDKTVDMIFCSHVLEHLPIRHAQMAIKEWSRVLHGTLFLAIPDLELIMRELLCPSLPVDLRQWYMHTLFGYQVDMGNRDPSVLDYPVDPGQFHCSGWSKDTICNDLDKNGFKIKEIFNFDGWGTPSIWVEAVTI